ncbi:related to guanine nucleotide-binding protein alpha-4 subunit [Pseudozyma flocculosa]|uniref:Related to guanine nucleotide-binding protein alpha-4 subunit n=1 Tax=Pseudozyma flocculosa TaxID=84751 RepID=A0A5C3FCI4_9BASI|nr:related to guanine nucleotide-binding protein alpha-4 subunit [Pseudozyma flocculosa]
MEDPITLALRPPARETPAERSARLAREAEAKKVSDEIDKRLREDANRRKKEKQGEVRILLLGQAGAGKTTIFKQMRLLYEPKAHEANRRWWREIVHLNVITALRGLLECLERLEAAAEPESQNSAMTAASGAERAISPSPSIMATAAEKRALLDRLKLAPILSLEQGLRQRLGPLARSKNPQHPILLRAGWQDRIMEKLGWLSSEGTESDAESVAESTRSSSGRADLIGSLRRKRSSPVLGQIDASAGGGSSAEGRTAEYQRIYTRRRMKRESAEQMLIALKEDVLQLWHSPSAKKLRKRGKLESSDSDIYFLNNYERIAQRGYEPTDEDILYARVRTVGISDERIRIDKATTYHLYDVGGSRSQRNAWASYFDDANAIIFLAPVSAFDQTLLEDPSVNRVADSLLLFEEIAANPLLRDVSLILFLNKIDILERKLLRGVKVADHFPDFDGENELEDVWRYFRKEFRLRVTSSRSVAPQRPIYVHTTIATSTRQIKAILNSVNDTILRENLRITGLAL